MADYHVGEDGTIMSEERWNASGGVVIPDFDWRPGFPSATSIEARITEWHQGLWSGRLHEALGWTRDELSTWAFTNEPPGRPLRARDDA